MLPWSDCQVLTLVDAVQKPLVERMEFIISEET